MTKNRDWRSSMLVKPMLVSLCAFAMMGLTACSSKDQAVQQSTQTVQTSQAVVTVRQVLQLSNKMTQAEFTLMALNDKQFVRQVLGKNVSENHVRCVYDHIDRDRYMSELPEVAQYLADNYPQDINNYIVKLDFLIPIVRKIYNYPEPVSFNTQNLSRSSALAILTKDEATELMAIINDERYAPLLATIGLPAKKADGTIEDISVMQIDSIMGYVNQARDLCLI